MLKNPKREIKEMEKKRNALRQNLYQAQDEVDSKKENLIKEIEARLKQNIGVNRKDIYELPFEALREAIANAIIHRDYSVRGTSLMVEVSDDRVEIINPGVFPWHQKKDFGKISVRRNEHIADLFFRMDKVELAGTGIRRMIEAMAAAGLPPPKIRQSGFYTITFKRP